MKRRASLILAVLIAGCVSAEKRYEQAQQAEAEGRWAAAADLYIGALRRDADYPGARDGLRASGGRAVDGYLSSAGDFEGAGRFEQAIGEYTRADSLIQRASAVHVVLEAPADFAERKRNAYARAMDQALDAGERDLAAGRFEQAANTFKRAIESFRPDAQQRARAQDGRYRALLAAAGELRDGARYQDAYIQVQRALAIYGEDAAKSADARSLRDKVIAEGTVSMAAVPVWRTERALHGLPAGLLDDVNDLLEDGPWSNPPLFVATVEAKEVRDALRALGLARRVITSQQAATVANHLDAAYVVLTYVRRSVVGGGGTEPVVEPVATKDGAGAEILVYSHRTLTIGCIVRIVRATDGEVVAEKTVRADAERKMRYAVKTGGAKDLLLTEKQHRMLDRRRLAEADRSLEKDATAALAKAIGIAVFDELLKQLP